MAATITSWAQSLDYRVIYDESAGNTTYQIPMGMPCVYGLSFWLTREEATSNQTAPAVVTNGTVKVTLLTSQL